MSQSTSSSHSLRKVLALPACLVAVLGLLAACGGSSDDSSSESSKITVLRSTGSTFEPLLIAENQGFFEDEGLDVTVKAGAQDTSQNAPSVVSGEAQFAMTDSSGFIKAAAQGLPVQIVSNLQQSDTSVDPSDGLVVREGKGISSFADVEGKTIALPALGGTLQFITEYSAEQAGADPSKIKFVSLPLTSIVSAVKSGQVDGAYVFATFLDGARAEGLQVIGEGTNALPGLPQSLIFSSSEYLEKNPETAKKFVAAVGKAIEYANDNPDAVRDIDTEYTELSAEYIANRAIQPFSATLDTSSITTIVDGMSRYGLIDSKPDIGDFLWSGLPTAEAE